MKIIVNQKEAVITGIVSQSHSPQELKEDEVEVVVKDKQLIDAFHAGEEIFYDSVAKRFYVQATVQIDPEKQALYEAVANLHEEIQELKHTGGVE